jgi:hypothetical protein
MKFHYYATSILDNTVDWLYPLTKIKDSNYQRFIQEVGAIGMSSVTYEFLLKYIQNNERPYQQPSGF